MYHETVSNLPLPTQEGFFRRYLILKCVHGIAKHIQALPLCMICLVLKTLRAKQHKHRSEEQFSQKRAIFSKDGSSNVCRVNQEIARTTVLSYWAGPEAPLDAHHPWMPERRPELQNPHRLVTECARPSKSTQACLSMGMLRDEQQDQKSIWFWGVTACLQHALLTRQNQPLNGRHLRESEGRSLYRQWTGQSVEDVRAKRSVPLQRTWFCLVRSSLFCAERGYIDMNSYVSIPSVSWKKTRFYSWLDCLEGPAERGGHRQIRFHIQRTYETNPKILQNIYV